MTDIVMYDVIILGSGPAGLTAALYCARGGKKTIVLGGDTLGGQMAGIAKLENYPGWAGNGAELAEFMKNQATSFGAEVVFTSAKTISGDWQICHHCHRRVTTQIGNCGRARTVWPWRIVLRHM